MRVSIFEIRRLELQLSIHNSQKKVLKTCYNI